ncbi:MAG TPA: type II toxin-antitoxin system MqsA family antitoxin [bacterium]|jgi:YgiT-type zinc finger domain-containing protein|nr:type II toxin-antitoxin system MqsA family antitoxin [bacterium]HNZ54133.1 type II toxin-antitoxin system MqsA family antitoxin [bacterium]HOB71226.1 type II toxin-antitoxin system MqsA family antitoxin [bacterium]HOG43884.1 type II toxin-antitoxin system MqsA family antitoxin [bacterium]HPA56466.1 type II toxin-antitoxin system MqsA family antitoxin [bacterium]
MKKCFVCKHNVIKPGTVNKMFENEGRFIIVKDIPALICENCGEIYFETEVMQKLETILSNNPSELEIISYNKAA